MDDGRRILCPHVNRRSVLKSLVAFVMARTGVARLFARGGVATTAEATAAVTAAQAVAPAAAFSAAEITTLGAIAEVVLPSALSADDRRLAVRAFTTWFNNYKPGADMGHGYGASTLRRAFRALAHRAISGAVRGARRLPPATRRGDIRGARAAGAARRSLKLR